MKLVPWDAQILLYGRARIGSIPLVAPQLKFFDAYYSAAPILGFHVIGAPLTPIYGLFIEADPISDDGAHVRGFYVEAGLYPEDPAPVVGFYVDAPPSLEEDSAPIYGFHVSTDPVPDESAPVLGFHVNVSPSPEDHTQAQIVGFYIIGNSEETQ